MIVTEGTKTEPQYFEEIRSEFRLHSANVAVRPSQLGTAPLQVVEYAKQLFENGDLSKGVRPRSFDRVYAVFDRDDHGSYFDALAKAESLSGRIKNDVNQPISFRAIASVPSFELWLLLHYEDIQAPIHRDEVMLHLKRHLPSYEKGASGSFHTTRSQLEVSTQRAQGLAAMFSAYSAPEPYTAIFELVTLLTTLRS
ncbi:MAG: RloB family protein [Rhodocyclaceae bacterium]